MASGPAYWQGGRTGPVDRYARRTNVVDGGHCLPAPLRTLRTLPPRVGLASTLGLLMVLGVPL